MKINNKSISIAFVIILAATVIISLAGMLLMSRQPLVLQGQVEATEIRISGKLPGRVDSFLVQEGDWVKAGDTLVVINSPTIEDQIPPGECPGAGGPGAEQEDRRRYPPPDCGHRPATLEQDAERPCPRQDHLPAHCNAL